MSTNVRATNRKKIKAETEAMISVSSLVSGSKTVNLKVACARITVNRKKTQIDSAINAGVLLRLSFCRVCGADGNIRLREVTGERGFAGKWTSSAGALIHY